MLKKLMCVTLTTTILLVGCSSKGSISKISPLSLEEVAGSRLAKLTNDEKEGLIYRYVSDTITVSKDNLIDADADDKLAIGSLLSRVNKDLADGTSKTLTADYANYLLLEFSKTPYTWAQSSYEVLGFDPASRLYFVDVTYKTTGNYKTVVPTSKIPLGSKTEEAQKNKRYTDYLSYLTYKSTGAVDKAMIALNQFTTAWGTPESVIAEQQGTSLLARTQQASKGDIGSLTYSGLVSESKLNIGAEMKIRYVLKYNFNLGELTDLGVNALYVMNYNLQNYEKMLTSYSSSGGYGVEVLKPFINETLTSYHKAVEGSDYSGLNDLFSNFGSVDKYYSDINKYMYTHVNGYNYRVLQRVNDNTIAVQVNRINNQRAIGSGMSLPTYEETLIVYMTLDVDDTIRIRSVNLLSSKLTGEPMSVIKNVSGVSDMIQYSGTTFANTNKVKVEEAVKKFAEVTFDATVESDKFTSVVDVGVSQSTLLKISDSVQAIPNATKKLNYIVSWNTKTNVYTSLTLREIFTTPEGTYDTESVIDLVNRNGDWKVVNYTRTMSVATSGNTLSSKNSLSENIAQ